MQREGRGYIMDTIQIISAFMVLDAQVSDNKYYHNAKKLISIYREVSWGLQYDLGEMADVCKELGYTGIEEALYLFDDDINSATISRIGDRTLSMQVTAVLMKVTENALIALREYPDHGEQYYNILNCIYISRFPLSEGELLEDMNISRSTYYRLKKKALSLLGAIIWGYMLPQIISDRSA